MAMGLINALILQLVLKEYSWVYQSYKQKNQKKIMHSKYELKNLLNWSIQED